MGKEHSTLQTRIMVISNKLVKLMESKNTTAKSIAQEIVDWNKVRRTVSHKHNLNLDKPHWVVLYPLQDLSNFTHSDVFESKDDAEAFLEEKMGDVGSNLRNWLIQKYHLDTLTLKPNPVSSVETYIKDLVKYQNQNKINTVGFPERYESEENFNAKIEDMQEYQLKSLAAFLDTAAEKQFFIQKEDGLSFYTEDEWPEYFGNIPYPGKEYAPVSLDHCKNSEVYMLLAIEDWLNRDEDDDEPLLFALKRSDEILGKMLRKTDRRPSLTFSELSRKEEKVSIGFQEGSPLRDLIDTMVKTGFDFHPLFTKKGTCMGTLELTRIMDYLSVNNFGSIPQLIDKTWLEANDLLSNAPPILDGRTPLHRVSDILLSGIGCVLVMYNSELWDEEKNADLSSRLEEGLHIFTTHDFVMARILKESGQ